MIRAFFDILKSLFIWWNKQTVSTRLYTYFSGSLVGEDSLGNKYYTTVDKRRRWVVYQKDNYGSEVSIEWHGWLHWTTNSIPMKSKVKGPEKGRVHPIDNIQATSKYMINSKNHLDYHAWDPDN